jgi:hypothetical protein
MAHAMTAAQDIFRIVNVEQVARLDVSYLSIGIWEHARCMHGVILSEPCQETSLAISSRCLAA